MLPFTHFLSWRGAASSCIVIFLISCGYVLIESTTSGLSLHGCTIVCEDGVLDFV